MKYVLRRIINNVVTVIRKDQQEVGLSSQFHLELIVFNVLWFLLIKFIIGSFWFTLYFPLKVPKISPKPINYKIMLLFQSFLRLLKYVLRPEKVD